MDNTRDEQGRFLPGHSGGPGRPPGQKSIPDMLRRLGEELADFEGQQFPRLEIVMRRVYEAATTGTPWAVQFLADRMEGRPAQLLRQEIKTDSPPPEDLETLQRQALLFLQEQGFSVVKAAS